MANIEWEKRETVGIITMNAGENRQNPDYIRAILAAFDEIEKDGEISSVIITSSDRKNWSLGIDLKWIAQAMAEKDFPAIREFMYGMNRVYRRVLLYPMPVIAAINGHAFGCRGDSCLRLRFPFHEVRPRFFLFSRKSTSASPFSPGCWPSSEKPSRITNLKNWS